MVRLVVTSFVGNWMRQVESYVAKGVSGVDLIETVSEGFQRSARQSFPLNN